MAAREFEPVIELLDAPTGGALPPMGAREFLLVRDFARLATKADGGPLFFWVQVESVHVNPDGKTYYVGSIIAAAGSLPAGELVPFKPINVFQIQARPVRENPFIDEPMGTSPVRVVDMQPSSPSSPSSSTDARTDVRASSSGWGILLGVGLGIGAVLAAARRYR